MSWKKRILIGGLAVGTITAVGTYLWYRNRSIETEKSNDSEDEESYSPEHAFDFTLTGNENAENGSLIDLTPCEADGNMNEHFEDALSHRSSDSSTYMSANEEEPGAFFKDALEMAGTGAVKYRKMRVLECKCKSEVDFLARLHCLRAAMDSNLFQNDSTLSDQYNDLGKKLVLRFLKSLNRDPSAFLSAYEGMVNWLLEKGEDVKEAIMDEIGERGVVDVTYYDVVLDFILLDAFDDLRCPPSAVKAILSNVWVPETIKGVSIENAVWGIIKTKSQTHVSVSNGFLHHFYAITATISPILTRALLVNGDSQAIEFRQLVEQYCEDLFLLPVGSKSVDHLRNNIISLNRQYGKKIE